MQQDLFEEAIRLDPRYAPGPRWSGLLRYSEGFLGFVAPKDRHAEGEAAVRRAMNG